MAKDTDHKLVHSLTSLEKRGCGSRNFLYDQIGAGLLKAHKLGRKTVILDPDLQAWLRLHKAKFRPNASKERRARWLERQQQRRVQRRSRSRSHDLAPQEVDSGHQ